MARGGVLAERLGDGAGGVIKAGILEDREESCTAMEVGGFPRIIASTAAMRTSNKIREIVENLDLKCADNSEMKIISLAIGDPTCYGNLTPNKAVVEAVVDAVRSGSANGYLPSTGLESARKAVAAYLATSDGEARLTAEDVVLSSGCSHALQMAITALVDPTKNQNILIPAPGFSLYKTIIDHVGVAAREYPLDPQRDWQVKLDVFEGLIDANTSAVLINNPSNPCGSVYSAEHLQCILDVCRRKRVPIIADDIYDGFVFGGRSCVKLTSLDYKVPVVSVGGLSKRFLVPGWRLGWIGLYDVDEALWQVRDGLERLATLIVGPNSLVQAAMPTILGQNHDQWMAGNLRTLEQNAALVYSRLGQIQGLRPVRPQGAMFMMVDVRAVAKSDVNFAQRLFEEKKVIVLPGLVFGAPGFVRLTFCAPSAVLEEACDRIAEFCRKPPTLSK